jgi:hypothetical protein
MLRRTKDEVLDLPPKLRTWLPVVVPEGTGARRSATSCGCSSSVASDGAAGARR